jgi:transposase-like protein
MSIRKKAFRLSLEVRRKIALYCKNNEHLSAVDVAEVFNVSEHQVRYACKQYDQGQLGTRPRGVSTARIKTESKKPDHVLMEEQFSRALGEMNTDDKIPLLQRVSMLESLTKIKQTVQRMTLQGHIKRADAEIIKLVIQSFIPDVSDEQVIKIYSEAYERWKHLA